MALAVIACIAQNSCDQMTAEDKMNNALIVIAISALIISAVAIVLIFI